MSSRKKKGLQLVSRKPKNPIIIRNKDKSITKTESVDSNGFKDRTSEGLSQNEISEKVTKPKPKPKQTLIVVDTSKYTPKKGSGSLKIVKKAEKVKKIEKQSDKKNVKSKKPKNSIKTGRGKTLNEKHGRPYLPKSQKTQKSQGRKNAEFLKNQLEKRKKYKKELIESFDNYHFKELINYLKECSNGSFYFKDNEFKEFVNKIGYMKEHIIINKLLDYLYSKTTEKNLFTFLDGLLRNDIFNIDSYPHPEAVRIVNKWLLIKAEKIMDYINHTQYVPVKETYKLLTNSPFNAKETPKLIKQLKIDFGLDRIPEDFYYRRRYLKSERLVKDETLTLEEIIAKYIFKAINTAGINIQTKNMEKFLGFEIVKTTVFFNKELPNIFFRVFNEVKEKCRQELVIKDSETMSLGENKRFRNILSNGSKEFNKAFDNVLHSILNSFFTSKLLSVSGLPVPRHLLYKPTEVLEIETDVLELYYHVPETIPEKQLYHNCYGVILDVPNMDNNFFRILLTIWKAIKMEEKNYSVYEAINKEKVCIVNNDADKRTISVTLS